jgi:hypothetical protein
VALGEDDPSVALGEDNPSVALDDPSVPTAMEDPSTAPWEAGGVSVAFVVGRTSAALGANGPSVCECGVDFDSSEDVSAGLTWAALGASALLDRCASAYRICSTCLAWILAECVEKERALTDSG